jgi:ornithine decarboxylase
VKANPAPEILRCWRKAWVRPSIAPPSAKSRWCWQPAATADRISYGNTIKKERDIARAYRARRALFAVDCVEEVEKIARAAPGARVFCRVLCDGDGAEWPLSRKFGCVPEMAADVLEHAAPLGLVSPTACRSMSARSRTNLMPGTALGDGGWRLRQMAQQGIFLKMVNMGGGFPTRYLKDVPGAQAYGQAIFARCASISATSFPKPSSSRAAAWSAMPAIKAEVVLVSRKSAEDDVRWVFLDIGKFGGLAETMDEAIRYSIRTARDGDATEPCVLAGPTCDSADVLYEKTPYPMPVSLTIGDEVLIEGTGAYTTTYSAVAFNGFEPLRSYVI